MAELETSERQSNQSSVRLLRILEGISENHGPVRLQDLAKQVHMTQSTVLRYLYALQDTHYIYQESDTLRYALTWRACRLTKNLNSLSSLREITRPFISQLSNRLSLGSSLVINRNDEALYLDCVDDPNYPAEVAIGKSLPMYSSGSGKMLLSDFPESRLEAYLKETEMVQFTPKTITDLTALRAELKEIREQGYAVDDEERHLGMRCISFPLIDYTGKTVAAISVYGNHYDLTDERIFGDVFPALQEAARTISNRLGYVEET